MAPYIYSTLYLQYLLLHVHKTYLFLNVLSHTYKYSIQYTYTYLYSLCFRLFSFCSPARRLRVRALLCWTWDGVSTAKLLDSPYSTLIFSHSLDSSGLVSFCSTFTRRQFLNSILDGVHSLFQVIAWHLHGHCGIAIIQTHGSSACRSVALRTTFCRQQTLKCWRRPLRTWSPRWTEATDPTLFEMFWSSLIELFELPTWIYMHAHTRYPLVPVYQHVGMSM